jgi:hypothetical protein
VRKLAKPSSVVAVVQAERLVGGDVDAGVLRGVLPPFLGFDDASVVAEGRLELVVGLFAQLVAVAQEQGGLG